MRTSYEHSIRSHSQNTLRPLLPVTLILSVKYGRNIGLRTKEAPEPGLLQLMPPRIHPGIENALHKCIQPAGNS